MKNSKNCLLGYTYTFEEGKKARNERKLLTLRIETSLACNMKCLYCAWDSGIPLDDEIDFEDLEEKLAEADVTLMMLCNPHNPIGKIWSRTELKKIADLCAKYDVTIISDEIHCDLTDPDKKYIPFAGISNHDSITTISPTKSFNIAGLNTAAVYIVGDKLKEDVFNALDVEWVSRANIFAINAAIAAYNNGRPWLDELRQYLYDLSLIHI